MRENQQSTGNNDNNNNNNKERGIVAGLLPFLQVIMILFKFIVREREKTNKSEIGALLTPPRAQMSSSV